MTQPATPSDDAGSRPKRPLGVWLLTIYYGFFAGLAPLVALFLAFFREDGRSALGLSWVDLVLNTLLALAIIAAAIGAWRGNNAARFAFVTLLAMHYGLLIVMNLSAAATGGLSESMQTSAVARSIRYLLHIGLNVWYFLLSGRPMAFYRPGTAEPKDAPRNEGAILPGDPLALEYGTGGDVALSFLESIQLIDDLPPGKYAMWWATQDDPLFEDSPCFRSWDSIYHTIEGIESWVIALLIDALSPSETKPARMKYPLSPLQFFVEGPEGQQFVLSLSEEKGIRFHFHAQQCDPAYRDRFVASFDAVVKAIRSIVEQQGSDLDPAWEPEALNWWKALKGVLRHLEAEGHGPDRLFGVVLVGDGEPE